MTKPSQWRAQIGALGLDEDAARESSAVAEQRRLAGSALPPLVLPPRERAPVARLPRLYAALAAAAASALAFAFWPKPPAEPWRAKGAANVRVYFERGGQVAPLADGMRLQENDRVRAEIDAGQDGAAYWLVTGADGAPLVDAAFIRDGALALKAGTSTPFARSIQIVGAPVGETLHVVVCPAPVADTAPAAVLGSKACTDKVFRLR